MNGEPDVSVLMPVAPDTPFLEQALRSICDQTLCGWEVVAVLDGASARNDDLIRQVVPKEQLTLIEYPDPVGIATALSTGLQHCRSELVARMDADDVCLPDRLRHQREFLMAHPEVVAVGSAAHVIDEYGSRRYLYHVNSGIDLRRRLLIRNQLIHPSVMFRRKVVERVGGYDSRLSGLEDFELWLRLSKAGVLTNLATPLLEYRIWTQQFSRNTHRSHMFPDILRARRMAAAHLDMPAILAVGSHFAWRLLQFKAVHTAIRAVRSLRWRQSY